MNRLYQFIFDHLQVIDDVRDFCDWVDLNINKRPCSPNGVTPAVPSPKHVHIMGDTLGAKTKYPVGPW